MLPTAGRLALLLFPLCAFLLALAFVALFLGSAPVSPEGVVRALTGRAAPESIESAVTLSLRLPRIIAAVLAGGSLAGNDCSIRSSIRASLATRRRRAMRAVARAARLPVASAAAAGIT